MREKKQKLTYAEKIELREKQAAEAKRLKQENHERFIREGREKAGINFDDLDDEQLAESIRKRAAEISDGIAEHEWNLTPVQVLHGEGDLEGDDLIRILINQNWVLIQQNELIARLLESGM